jgi:hypothetical protein
MWCSDDPVFRAAKDRSFEVVGAKVPNQPWWILILIFFDIVLLQSGGGPPSHCNHSCHAVTRTLRLTIVFNKFDIGVRKF